MRMSRYFAHTMRDVPSDASMVSHQLMLRAGLIRQTAAGIYSWLPLGLRVLNRIEQIVREEMDRAGANEFLLPTVQSADIWRQSERYDAYGPEMLRFRDRHDREFLYGPTAEEAATLLFKDCVASYRDLGQVLYQIQWKFRDEIRPRHGVMRGREFLMKDAYSFDIDGEAAAVTYERMKAAYVRVFERMGLVSEIVEADSGPIGGTSHEFHVGGIEVGHIFNFGTRYAEKLDLVFETPEGRIHPHMGSYGIGISRLIAAIIEQSHDKDGIIWPMQVAPFCAVVINLTPKDEAATAMADALYADYCQNSGPTLYDDRDVRAGMKFAEADLIGVPMQIIVGAKGAANGTYDFKDRRTGRREECRL